MRLRVSVGSAVSAGLATSVEHRWKTTLPKKGFTASSAQRAFGAAEITFHGHGRRKGSQIAISGKRATVQCKRG